MKRCLGGASSISGLPALTDSILINAAGQQLGGWPRPRPHLVTENIRFDPPTQAQLKNSSQRRCKPFFFQSSEETLWKDVRHWRRCAALKL